MPGIRLQAGSAPARQKVREAYEDLEKTIAPMDSREFSTTTLRHVKEAALKIETQLAARLEMRNMRRLIPLFQGMEHYAKVVDVLCNGTPYLPWIWAPITLILRIALEHIEAFEKIMQGYARIGESFSRIVILHEAFKSDEDFQQILAIYYADMLQFHKHAYKFVRRSGWKLFFLTSWGRFERRFENIFENLKRHQALIDQEANARNISESQQMRREIRAWREEIRDWKNENLAEVERFEEKQSAKQFASVSSWLKAHDSDQLSIFDALSSEGAKYPGTCNWALKNTSLGPWLGRASEPTFICLQGAPGSGKSVLLAQLINFLVASQNLVLYHFCSDAYASSTKYDQILKSLILQLLRSYGELVAYVYGDWVCEKKSPSTAALERLLQTMLSNLASEPHQKSFIWIVLDGLDVCEKETQGYITSLMSQIATKSSTSETRCKVLLSSRTSPILSRQFRRRPIVSLTEEKNCLDQAIREYVSQRLQSINHKLLEIDIGPAELREIEDEITQKADGMFLYARLVIDYIDHNIFLSGDDIKESVHELPPTLAGFYAKLLTQLLIQLNERSRSLIRSIFAWIAFAKRPLKKLEFLSALTFSSGDAKVAHLVPQHIFDYCGPLIEERKDTTLAFIHVSVKEFLQFFSDNLVIRESEALVEHGIATVTCLLSGLDIFDKSFPEEVRNRRVVKGFHSFHSYTTEYWTSYILSHTDNGCVSPNSMLIQLSMRLAERLESATDLTAEESRSNMSNEPIFSNQLALFLEYPVLHKQLEKSLKARSIKQLETELLQTQGIQEPDPVPPKEAGSPTPKSSIMGLLKSYQETVGALLDKQEVVGVTYEELDRFKTYSRSSAFTCRLQACPRAIDGFESKAACREHEMQHTRLIPCIFPDCQYPYFTSKQSLRNHLNQSHQIKPAQRSIRRVGRIQEMQAHVYPRPRAVRSMPRRSTEDDMPPIDMIKTKFLGVDLQSFPQSITEEYLYDFEKNDNTIPNARSLDILTARLEMLRVIAELRGQACARGLEIISPETEKSHSLPVTSNDDLTQLNAEELSRYTDIIDRFLEVCNLETVTRAEIRRHLEATVNRKLKEQEDVKVLIMSRFDLKATKEGVFN